MKKIFYISLISLFITIFFLGVYNFVFKKNDSKSLLNGTSRSQDGNKTENKTKIMPVSKGSIIGPDVDLKNSRIVYFSLSDGTAWQVDESGVKNIQISDKNHSGIIGAEWSADKSKAIISQSQNGKIDYFEYDYSKGLEVKLKDNLDNVAWDNLGVKIIYKYFDEKTKKRTLNLANPDGSGWQTLAEIPFRNMNISEIPLSSTISFWNKPSYYEQSNLESVGITGGGIKTLFSGRYGADYLWSSDGNRALVSSLKSQGSNVMTLGLIKRGGDYKDLGIATLVSKCVWARDDSSIIYCAVPNSDSILSSAVMPNDYQDKKFTTKDLFYKINTETGIKDKIAADSDLIQGYDATNLLIPSSNDALFFVNRIDGKLYRMAL